MIPDIRKGEWADILSGSLNPKLTSFSLQMKVNTLKLNVKLQKTSLVDAVYELYKFVSSNEQMYQKDVNTIFKLS